MHRCSMDELKITISTISTERFQNSREMKNTIEDNITLQDTQIKEVMGAPPVALDTIQLSSPSGDEDSLYCSWLQLARRLVGSIELNQTVRRQSSITSIAGTSADCFERAERCVSIQPPTWLLARRYQIRSRKAHSGWDHRFRTYYPTSSTAPVFKLCMEGNVGGLRELFQAGLASPFNTDYDGFTTLHVS
jgi:hypothetical protein